MSSNKKIITQLWGNDAQANEIEAIFDKYNLDMSKLMTCCQNKGQDIFTAVGAVLAMNDKTTELTQCTCGEIMSFPKKISEKMKTLNKNGEIKCKRCDPDFFEKLSKATGRSGNFMSFRIN